MPARPAHTHSHTDTRSHPRAPPLSSGAAHLIPYAGGVSHRRGFGGERGRRGGRGAGGAGLGGPLALKLRACTGGIERVLQGTGASPPCSRRSSARPPLAGAGGAGTWAGAIPRPKNNGRELGRGRGEAAPQRLPGWGSGATPRGGDEMPRVGHQGLRVPGEPVCKAGEASPEEGGRTRPFPISPFKEVALRMWRGQRPYLKHCAAPTGGTQGLPCHPVLKQEEWSLRSCNEPSHCAWLARVTAFHPQDKALESIQRQGPSDCGVTLGRRHGEEERKQQ